MTYRFLSLAENELRSAAEYYENAVPGLGVDFVDEIERTIERVLKHPNAWAKVSEDHRRCRTRRFPYGIIYSIEDECILISAVMNLRQHPGRWKQ